ncbi:DEAD/DEAH box helicase [Vibrio campbellii]|uniref:DEAD/DEAH box helicase n=1 Tax=Vibrio campbellii TaxID=680 RepID=UPI000CD372F7|nr:DEAD/DEAH box helicase family protein [Vibrio campbellii]AUW04392.1 diguanylate cyclase [Vibrio campbellii]
MLREWQLECAEKAVQKYKNGQRHFFCQATPGAGKTVLAATVASRLLQDNMIDLVLCFSPSLTVSDGIKTTFAQALNCSFSGGLGSIGQSLTYQSLKFLNDEFWRTLDNYRVFVVFDEIHHCSGTCFEDANTWGQQILLRIQRSATFTLAMSGTPWRSDCLPIVMGEYKDPSGKLLVDYQYTLKRAIEEGICRTPRIVLVDNEQLSVASEGKVESFSSILEMMKQTNTSYQSVIHNKDAMEYLLKLGCRQLAKLRIQSPNAGGLVVAASVNHANMIKNILVQKYYQTVSMVTYRHQEPLAEIEKYRKANTQWIVSVGMISEGTDIPRLQVCCHMSSTKTELYFRQVLGRILRVNSKIKQYAWLFTFAEPNLISFSQRVEEDIPQCCKILRVVGQVEYNIDPNNSILSETASLESHSVSSSEVVWCSKSMSNEKSRKYLQDIQDINEVNFGCFRQRVISAFVDFQT